MKVQYPGGMADTYNPARALVCTDYTSRVDDPFRQIISTVAGLGKTQSLSSPYGIAIGYDGSIYIADTGNHCIRKFSPTGVESVVAGTPGVFGFEGDEGLATLSVLYTPDSIALNSVGDLYISDSGNNCIRKISSGTITTYAGLPGPVGGYGGDNEAANQALLDFPRGLAFDQSGNLLIADQNNHRIRKVSVTTNIITTIAGTGIPGIGGDCLPATLASLNYPRGITVDGPGNIYIADRMNYRIRVIIASSNDKIISTVVGTGISGFTVDGSLSIDANIQSPENVIIGPNNDLYFSDGINHRIRKTSLITGLLTTVVGNGGAGFAGDGWIARNAMVNGPSSIAFDSGGNMYIADTGNNCIRKVVNGITTVYTPGWFTPLEYYGTKKYSPVTRGVTTLCPCPQDYVPPPSTVVQITKCSGKIYFYGGSATDVYTIDDIGFNRFQTTEFYGGSASNAV